MLSNPPEAHKGNKNLPNERQIFAGLRNTHTDHWGQFHIPYKLRT